MKTKILTLLLLSFFLALSTSGQDYMNHKGPYRNSIVAPGVGLRESLNDQLDLLVYQTNTIGYVSRDHNVSGICVADDHVYVAVFEQKSGDNVRRILRCIDPNGNVKWTYPRPGVSRGTYSFTDIKIKPITAPCYYNGRVFVRMKDGLACVDATDGSELWFSSGSFEESKHPFIIDDKVVIQETSGKFRGYDAMGNGTGYWISDAMYTRHLNCPHRAEIWRTPNKNYIISSTKTAIYCINPDNGNTVWTSSFSASPPSDKSSIKRENTQMIYFISDEGPNGNDQYGFELFPDEPTKKARLICKIAEDKRAGAFMHQGYLYHGTSRRGATRFIAFDPVNNGNELWRYDGWNTFPGQLPTSKDDSYKAYTECLMVDGRMVGTHHRRIGFFLVKPNSFEFQGHTFNYRMSDVNAPVITKEGKMYFISIETDRVTASVTCIDLAAPTSAKPTITQDYMPDGKVGAWYHIRLWVMSGTGTRTWTASGLPPGLSIDNNTHMLEGFPTTSGTYTFTLTVTDVDGESDSKQFTIFIEDDVYHAVTGVSLNKSSSSIDFNTGEQLVATVEPSNATNRNVTWSSSDDTKVTVDQNGNIFGVGAGTATITVTTDEGGYSDQCVVTVGSCTITPTVSIVGCKATMQTGENYCLTASITDPCGSLASSNTTWVSSDASVATVGTDGCVTAVSPGAVTITATISNGESATCTFSVEDPPPANIYANKTNSTINIDGVIDEAEWQLVHSANKVVSGATDNNSTFGILWDENYFYVAVNVEDANLHASTDGTKPWKGDAVEVYLDGNNEKASSYDNNDYQVVKGYNNSTVFNSTVMGGIQHAIAATSNGYAAEFAFAWTDLSTTPFDGKSLGFDVGVDDDDDGAGRDGQSMFFGDGTNWSDPSVFGTVGLVDNGGVEQYSLQIIALNGSVTASPDKTFYDADEQVTLTASPALNYEFVDWGGDISGTDNPVTITMDQNKSVTANFSKVTYNLTTTATNGSISVSPDKTEYSVGESVSLVANPAPGYQFDGWSGDATGTSNPLDITMDKNKNIEALFSLIPTYTLTLSHVNGSITVDPQKTEYQEGETVNLTAVPDNGYQFDGWAGDASGAANSITVTMDSDKTITANFSAATGYTLTIFSSNGIVAKSPDKASYTTGETVNLAATPNAGYEFVSWSGDVIGTNNTISITMDGNKTVTANFSQITYTLDVIATNGNVSKSPDKVNYATGEVVVLQATADAGYEFTGWSGDASGTSLSVSVTMDGNKNVTANFSPIVKYTLDVTATNGSVSVVPDKSEYDVGEQVSLVAAPNSGYEFTGWSGDATGSNTSVVITMDGNKSVTANFSEIVTYSLTLVYSNGSVITSPAKSVFNDGETVQLTAVANQGYQFDGWSGGASGTSDVISVVMDSDKTINANFTAIQYTISKSSINGTITLSPDKPTYNAGETVTITATPDAGYEFSNWIGDIPGKTNPYSLTMDQDLTISAVFGEMITGMESLGQAGIVLYPVPCQQVLNVQSNEALTGYKVTNNLGQVVMSGEANGQETRIDATSLSAGVYYLQLKNQSGEMIIRKFMKE